MHSALAVQLVGAAISASRRDDRQISHSPRAPCAQGSSRRISAERARESRGEPQDYEQVAEEFFHVFGVHNLLMYMKQALLQLIKDLFLCRIMEYQQNVLTEDFRFASDQLTHFWLKRNDE